MSPASASPTQTLEQIWRRDAPRVLAGLMRRHHNFDDCEDAAQEALAAATRQWPTEGMPRDPLAWLIAVGHRRLVDQTRSETARRSREQADARREGLDRLDDAARLAREVDAGESDDSQDDVLHLMVLCCHEALTPSSQVALMLRAVAGLTTTQIADGFLVPSATMGQRISRAKSTLRGAGARFAEPTPAEWPARLDAVRHALLLLFSQGHTSSDGASVTNGVFADDAVRLARQVVEVAPHDPESAGLLALMLLTRARFAARRDASGRLVPLDEQDRSLWDHAAIAEGIALLERALPAGPVGEFQLQAAIAAVHAEAESSDLTDWPQIVELYRMLDRVAPAPPVTIGLAVATAEVDGAATGLALLDDRLGPPDGSNHRHHAVRGQFLARLGRFDEAEIDLHEAARLTRNIAEQRHLNGLLADVRAART